MIHRVKLSNGRVLLVEEQDNALSIGVEEEGIQNEYYMYICKLVPDQVVVMCNSSDATYWLVNGLGNITLTPVGKEVPSDA